jgi:hypothetical protein
MSFHITIRHITLNHHQCWDMFRACIPVLAVFFSRNHFIGSDPKNCCGCDYQLPGVSEHPQRTTSSPALQWDIPPNKWAFQHIVNGKILALVGFPANHEHHRPKAWNAGVVPEVNVW